MSVSNSSPSRTEHQNQSEAQSQEASPQQVTQSCEVGDGEVVWIQSPLPQPFHHQAGHIEQNHHLEMTIVGHILKESISGWRKTDSYKTLIKSCERTQSFNWFI